MARSAFLWFFTESWGSKQGIRRSPKSCTRKEHESATNPIAKRGQGAMPLAGSRDSVPCGVWGSAPTVPRVTSMPNMSNKRRRQRSVPASNFARPQTRPQAALFNIYAVSRQMGATEQLVFQTQSIFSASRGFRRCGGDQMAMKTDECLRSPVGNLRVHLHVTWSLTEIR